MHRLLSLRSSNQNCINKRKTKKLNHRKKHRTGIRRIGRFKCRRTFKITLSRRIREQQTTCKLIKWAQVDGRNPTKFLLRSEIQNMSITAFCFRETSLQRLNRTLKFPRAHTSHLLLRKGNQKCHKVLFTTRIWICKFPKPSSKRPRRWWSRKTRHLRALKYRKMWFRWVNGTKW